MAERIQELFFKRISRKSPSIATRSTYEQSVDPDDEIEILFSNTHIFAFLEEWTTPSTQKMSFALLVELFYQDNLAEMFCPCAQFWQAQETSRHVKTAETNIQTSQ